MKIYKLFLENRYAETSKRYTTCLFTNAEAAYQTAKYFLENVKLNSEKASKREIETFEKKSRQEQLKELETRYLRYKEDGKQHFYIVDTYTTEPVEFGASLYYYCQAVLEVYIYEIDVNEEMQKIIL